MSSYFHTYSDPDATPLQAVLRLTARAWSETLIALAEGDRAAARAVLRGDRLRRRAVREAHDAASVRLSAERRAAQRLVSASCAVHLVADTARIERLLVHLARHVVAGEQLPATIDVEQVRHLADLGERRLRRLSERIGGVNLLAEPTDRGELIALFDELVEIAHRTPAGSRSNICGICAALAGSLLEASRHAARAA